MLHNQPQPLTIALSRNSVCSHNAVMLQKAATTTTRMQVFKIHPDKLRGLPMGKLYEEFSQNKPVGSESKISWMIFPPPEENIRGDSAWISKYQRCTHVDTSRVLNRTKVDGLTSIRRTCPSFDSGGDPPFVAYSSQSARREFTVLGVSWWGLCPEGDTY